LDVGSGGGLPGIPLAIAMPQARVTLIDTVHKKTAFLTQVKAALKLDNLSVITNKVEATTTLGAPFDVITSRAFSSLAEFVKLAQHLLAPEGFFAAMKGVVPEQEIRQLPAGFCAHAVIPLQVPGLEAERCVVLIKKA
jgi:16S rRNA (guanine527-N7)-methyltransferase